MTSFEASSRLHSTSRVGGSGQFNESGEKQGVNVQAQKEDTSRQLQGQTQILQAELSHILFQVLPEFSERGFTELLFQLQHNRSVLRINILFALLVWVLVVIVVRGAGSLVTDICKKSIQSVELDRSERRRKASSRKATNQIEFPKRKTFER
jgi:hypothetical protein